MRLKFFGGVLKSNFFQSLVLSALMCMTTPMAGWATTVMPLGDAITLGYNGDVDGSGYRMDLLNDLAAQGKQIQYTGSYDPTLAVPIPFAGYSPALTALGENYVNAFGGYSSTQLLDNLNGSVQPSGGISNQGGYWLTGGNGTGRTAAYPDIVLLMTGDNDSFMGIPVGNASTPGTMEGNIAGILSWFAANRPNTKVFVAIPPLTNNNQNALNASLVSLEGWLPEFVPTNYPNDGYVDMIPVVPSNLLNSNGVNPTDAGYANMASAWDNAIGNSIVPEPSYIGFVALGLGLLARRQHPTRNSCL